MAEDREPPPLLDEEDLVENNEDEDDLFASTVQSFEKSTIGNRPIGVDGLLKDGGGVEVKLDEGGSDEEEAGDTYHSTVTLTENEERTSAPATMSAELSSCLAQTAAIPKPRVESTEKDDGEFIEVSVTDPQKIGDGMVAYMAYKIITKTSLRYFKRQHFSVMRRFSDFLGLHEKLSSKHTHLGRIVPPAPEKSVIGMTKIKMSKDSDQGASSDFVEKRRASLERYLSRTAAHPVLCADPDFREFLELDAELPKATSTSALSGAGVLRLFNRVGDTVSKMTFKMDETDPWFEDKQQQIENLDQQLKKLHLSVEALVHFRRELASSTALFAKSAAMLSNCEEHTALSRALSQLAEVEEKVDQLHQDQANQDFFVFSELLRDYISLILAVKDVFHQRVKVYQTWQHAQQMLTKKREAKAKLEIIGKQDKVPQAAEEVMEWESKVERGKEEFDSISKVIRKEMERFEYNRVKDFKDTFIKYMESLMGTQQKLIKYWEGFLPEAKTII